MKYFDELKRSMDWLGEQNNTYFMGQAVAYEGTGMYKTLQNVPIEKRLEMPVAEAMQLGMSIGMALEGYCPISIFPRWNFLLCAVSELVNHLDKYPLISEYKPKVIVRVSIGSQRPLHPSLQHVGDFTESIQKMCETIKVIRLDEPDQIFPAYQNSYYASHSSVIVEWGDYYNEK